MKTVVIVGGGIAGLSTAYYLQKQAREQALPLRFLLLEKEERTGGKIMTVTTDSYIIETGPDSFLARKKAALELCREFGLEGELVGTNPLAKKTYIVHKGKLERIPPGTNMGIPTQFTPFASTRLISPLGKARALLDLILPRSRGTDDQSLGHFIARRLGTEVLDAIVEPILAGIYAGDARQLSLRATFPQFETMERQYRSLILGILAQKKAMNPAPPPAAEEQGLPKSMFLTLKSGLSTLAAKTAEALESASVRTGVKATQVEKRTEESGTYYYVHLDPGEPVKADAVVLATPAFAAAALVPQESQTARYLRQIPYVSVATVILAYPQEAFPHPLDGSGFVVPRKEGRAVTACTWISSKWSHTAPPGQVLLRCYVGRAGMEAIVDRSDDEILAHVRHDLAELVGLMQKPTYSLVTRWHQAMPQYTVGHLERLQEIEAERKARWPGLFLAGAGYRGLGVPDCILDGRKTAEQVVAYLKERGC